MKLRSGKIIGYTLPKKLEDKINSILEEYKSILTNYKTFSKDLLLTISNVTSLGDRTYISGIIDNFIADKEEVNLQNSLKKIYPLVGSLILLITGKDSFYDKNGLKPVYGEIICNRFLDTADSIDNNTNDTLLGDLSKNYGELE